MNQIIPIKVTQITSSSNGLYALCEDGSIYVRPHQSKKWKRVKLNIEDKPKLKVNITTDDEADD